MNNRTIWKLAILLICAAGLLLAQQAQPAPQAASQSPVAKQPVVKSKEEADAIMAMFNAKDPDSRIAAAEAFIQKFADTQFKGVALFFIAASFMEKNDYEKTITYAERSLQADPESYQAMLLITRTLAARTKEFDLDREEKLATVEKYGNRVLELMKTAPRPNPNITDEQWAGAKKDFIAQVYEAFGTAAMARNKPDQAIEQYRKALDASPNPDPATMVRLGLAYAKATKYDDAVATFDKVMAIPQVNPSVRGIAQAERVRALQNKNGGAAPAAPAQPAAVKP
jgi:tetratricopeptide (TPR) repeat protein